MRQRRHSHKNKLAYKPEKKRWFLRKEDGAIRSVHERFCFSFEASSKWIEIEESDLKYWQNKPEGEWEIRKPKRGVRFLNPKSMRECLSSADSTTYRWCRPLKDRFDAMADELLGVYHAAPTFNKSNPIAAYLREQLEREVQR